MQREYDIKAVIANTGRIQGIFSDMRFSVKIKNDHITTSLIHFCNEKININEVTEGEVKFITPEYYPHSLYVNKEMEMYEGSKKVGIMKVIEIYNEILNGNVD